jgi:hypothetical protein
MGWALSDAVLVLPRVAGAVTLGVLAIAKELHMMGEMIGEDHGARLAKATPARLTNDDWVPPAWAVKSSMNSVQVWPHEYLTFQRHIFGENMEEIMEKRKE